MKELDKILNEGENIFWEGKPDFRPFLLGGSLPFGITVFAVFWLSFLKFAFPSIDILRTPHFWTGIALLIGGPLFSLLNFKHSYYAITNKRVLIQKGIIGRDFDSIDFDQITNSEVGVGIIDKLFGGNTGTISISTAGSSFRNSRGSMPYRISNIVNPYDVFKLLKQVSHDVKTDIQYPNAMRPDMNPGYNTQYDPDKSDNSNSQNIV